MSAGRAHTEMYVLVLLKGTEWTGLSVEGSAAVDAGRSRVARNYLCGEAVALELSVCSLLVSKAVLVLERGYEGCPWWHGMAAS